MMEIGQAEKRFDEYLEGLFWTTVFGLGVILGGAIVLTKFLNSASEWSSPTWF
jgi:hypothetical protein